jgi:hypothetical protein
VRGRVFDVSPGRNFYGPVGGWQCNRYPRYFRDMVS